MSARRLAPAGALFCAALLAAGCSLDYAATETGEASMENIPDTVAVNILHRVHRDGRLSLQVEASRAETYNTRRETILSDARFIEYDAAGGVATEGAAKNVTYNSDSENAQVSGSVRAHSAREKAGVEAKTLSWENKARMLTAPPGDTVVLRKDDGSSISGTGFSGDLRARRMVFAGPVEGTYVWEDTGE